MVTVNLFKMLPSTSITCASNTLEISVLICKYDFIFMPKHDLSAAVKLTPGTSDHRIKVNVHKLRMIAHLLLQA